MNGLGTLKIAGNLVRNYYILENANAGPCVVQAPSPGTAIEFFLAIHGLLSYDDLICEPTQLPPDETVWDVLRLIPNAYNKVEQTTLDRHHKWRRMTVEDVFEITEE